MFPVTVKFGDAAKGNLRMLECFGIEQGRDNGEAATFLIVPSTRMECGIGVSSFTKNVVKASITDVLSEMETACQQHRVADMNKFQPA